MQILLCLNAATVPRYAVGVDRSEQDRWPPPSDVVPASPRPPDVPVTGEHTIAQESLTEDVQDGEDPDGYGFGV
jgi:hypothetical protein